MFKMSKNKKFQVPPLRSLDDFLLESARFQVPNMRSSKDLESWGNRVSNNLLYYQTNYFFISFVLIMIVGMIHPIHMLCGFVTTIVIFLVFLSLTYDKASATQFKKRHPIVSVILILLGVYIITYLIGALLIFWLGILLPMSICFIHASMRLRNIKNKLVNRVESLGLMITPMGFFLEEMGFEPEPF